MFCSITDLTSLPQQIYVLRHISHPTITVHHANVDKHADKWAWMCAIGLYCDFIYCDIVILNFFKGANSDLDVV